MQNLWKTNGPVMHTCNFKIPLSKALQLPLLKLGSLKHFSTLQFQMKHLSQTLHDSSRVVRRGHPLRHYAPQSEKSRRCSKGGRSIAEVLNALQAPFTCEKLIRSRSVACERFPTLHSRLAGCQPVSEVGGERELPHPFIPFRTGK